MFNGITIRMSKNDWLNPSSTTHAKQQMAARNLPSDGKSFGQLKKAQEEALDAVLKEFPEVPEEQQQKWKAKFIEIDLNNSGDIDEMELKYMFERMDQAKTHLELKKMIEEVNVSKTGAITFREFMVMMTGNKSSVLQKILLFEDLNKPKQVPKGLPSKKSFTELP